MHRVLVIVLLLVLGKASAAENLIQEDYSGTWNSDYAAVKNEKQILIISLSSVSVFERHFENKNTQVLNTETFELVDDLLILTFTSPDNVFGYKLVLSGWKSNNRKMLYGSMFMYRKGTQFNMLPVSFVAAE
jgi:hypothetical protein